MVRLYGIAPKQLLGQHLEVHKFLCLKVLLGQHLKQPVGILQKRQVGILLEVRLGQHPKVLLS